MEETNPGAPADAAAPQTDEQTQKRERSQIEFPYADIGSAEELVKVLFSKGGGSAEPTQLAGWLDMSANGGTFRSRVGAARLNGLVDTTRGGIEITDLGRRVSDERSAPAARVEGFLSVPLFSKMLDKYNGYALPPVAAIERQMVELGVPMKQKDRARQVFQKSAVRAQFIDQSSGRFIKPAVSRQHTVEDAPPPKHEQERGGSGGRGGGREYHPFIQGLLDELPETDGFASWSMDDQAEWLRTAAGIFKLMSKQKGQGRIVVRIENESPGREAGASRVTDGTSTPSVLD